MKHLRKEIGIELHEESKPSGLIKRCNRDFIVCELANGGMIPLLSHQPKTLVPSISNSYALFNMTKEAYTTKAALTIVANQLSIPEKSLSYQGMKDRWALTSQLISIETSYINPENNFQHDLIRIAPVDHSRQKLRRGGNSGNHFQIRVRNCFKLPESKAFECIPNFYGMQRFGHKGLEHRIGHSLLFGSAKEAFSKISFLPQKRKFENALELCEGDYEEAFLHPSVIEQTKFALLQWQSYLFNKLVSWASRLGKKIPTIIPLWTSLTKSLYECVFNPGIVNHKFEKLLPRTKRKTHFSPANLSFTREKDGDIVFKFDLPSGSYATTVLGQTFDLHELQHGG